MRVILRALLVLLAAGAASAQDAAGPEPTHQLALELGGLWQGVNDRMASPLRYTGVAAAPGIEIRGTGPVWSWAVRGTGSPIRLTSSISEADSGFQESTWLSASGRLLRRVWRPRPHLTVLAGPALALEAGTRWHTYTPGVRQDFDAGFLALQAAATAELELDRYGRVSEQLAVPVVGVAVRKEYAGVTGRGPRVMLALPPSFLLLHHRLEYRLPAPGAVGARLFHEAGLLRHADPERLAWVSHRLGLAVVWRWGTP